MNGVTVSLSRPNHNNENNENSTRAGPTQLNTKRSAAAWQRDALGEHMRAGQPTKRSAAAGRGDAIREHTRAGQTHKTQRGGGAARHALGKHDVVDAPEDLHGQCHDERVAPLGEVGRADHLKREKEDGARHARTSPLRSDSEPITSRAVGSEGREREEDATARLCVTAAVR